MDKPNMSQQYVFVTKQFSGILVLWEFCGQHTEGGSPALLLRGHIWSAVSNSSSARTFGRGYGGGT